MSDARRIYSINSNSEEEINGILSQLAERLDQMEGYRGTPTLQADLDMNGFKVLNRNTSDDAKPTLMSTPYSASSATTETVDISEEDFSDASLIWGYLELTNPSLGVAVLTTDTGSVRVASDSAAPLTVPFCMGLEGTELIIAGNGSLLAVTITGYM